MPSPWTRQTQDMSRLSYSRRKIEQLLQSWIHSGKYQGLQALNTVVEMMVTADDIEVISSRLDHLDISLLPLEVESEPSRARLETGWMALIELEVMVWALHEVLKKNEKVRPYLHRCYVLFVERWAHIIAWRTHEMLHFPERAPKGIGSCVNFLTCVLLPNNDAEDPFREELATKKSTLDLLCVLLCQVYRRTDPPTYCYVPPPDSRRCCQLIELLKSYLSSPPHSVALQQRLCTVKSRTRKAIVSALLGRTEQLSYRSADCQGDESLGNISSFSYLLGIVRQLSTIPAMQASFHGTHWLHRFASTLAVLVQRDTTEGPSSDIAVRLFAFSMQGLVFGSILQQPDPGSALMHLMGHDGQFFRLAEMLSHHSRQTTGDILVSLGHLLPYLYSSKLFLSANISGHALHFANTVTEKTSYSNEEGKVLEDEDCAVHFQEFARYLNETYTNRKGRCISICHNPAHPHDRNQALKDGLPDRHKMKVCSKCHSVMYCSSECQTEDWVIHASQCAGLAAQYRVEKDLRYRVSIRLKIDQLRIIDTIANRELPPPSELNGSWKLSLNEQVCPNNHPESEQVEQPSSTDDAPMSLFKFFIDSKTLERDLKTTAQKVLDTTLGSPAMDLQIRRMEGYIRDLHKNWDTIALVGGVFLINEERVMVAVTRMKYDSKAPDGYRYTITSSFFCVVVASQATTQMATTKSVNNDLDLVTPGQMLKFMELTQEADSPNDSSRKTQKRGTRSAQRSAAVVLAAQLNALRLRDAEEVGDQPGGTLHPVMVPCLEDINLHFNAPGDVDRVTLVVFGLPKKGRAEDVGNRFVMRRIAPSIWEYDGLIHLPAVIPDLTIVVESEILGDIGCVSLAAEDLEVASSASLAEDGEPPLLEVVLKGDLEDSVPPPKISLVVGNVLTEETRYILAAEETPQNEVDEVRISEDDPTYTSAVLLQKAQDLLTHFRSDPDPKLEADAIDHCYQALALVRSLQSQGGHDTTTYITVSTLVTLGGALSTRFERTGNAADINNAISLLEESLASMNAVNSSQSNLKHSDVMLSAAKRHLGLSFVRRFQSSGNPEDVNRAIELQREECDNIAHRQATGSGKVDGDGVDDPGPWIRLGTSLRNRFEHSGSPGDIEESVECHRRALRFFPVPGSQTDLNSRAFATSDLGSALLQRYKSGGTLNDLDEAIFCFREATGLIKSTWSGNHSSETAHGQLNDINEAISIQQETLSTVTPAEPMLHTILNNLALCWHNHYTHTQDRESLRETAATLQMAADATPAGHPKLSLTLNNLATAYADIFRLTREMGYLSQAIEAQSRAIALTATAHPSIAMMYSNLGSYFRQRFTATSDLSDIQKSIDAQQKAATYSSRNHPQYPAIVASLGQSFLFRFKLGGDVSDLHEAIRLMEDASASVDTEHGSTATNQLNLARAYTERYLVSNVDADMDKALSLFSLAANSQTTSPRVRIDIAREWAGKAAFRRDPIRTLDATQTYMDLVAVVTGIEWTVERRYELLSDSDIPSFIIQAAGFFALKCLERPDKALEWLEQGRAIVWQALSGLRAPLDDLRLVEPVLADRIQDISKRLERESLKSRFDMDLLPGMLNAPELEVKMSLHEQASLHARLSKEREDTLNTIRTTVPGFENFLQPRAAQDIMRHLPEEGPVIVLSVHLQGCYALALLAGLDEPVYIPLPEYTLEKALNASSLLWATVDRYGLLSRGVGADNGNDEGCGTRGLRRYQRKKGGDDPSVVERVLHELWVSVVKPIFDALALSPSSGSEAPTRIWWCTSGPMGTLPIHAAGIYAGDSPICVADYVVSSYIPTVASLNERVKVARPPRSKEPISKRTGIFSISQPNTPGCLAIPGTTAEVKSVIRQAVECGVPERSLQGSEATIEESLKGLEEFTCVHLACHASQQQGQPLRSGFALHDGRLELSMLMKLDLKGADLAFLSACQTGEGDREIPEEAVHLAAAMLNAGYRGVVATMWSIQDGYAPEVAQDFYEHLLGACNRDDRGLVHLDGSNAAYALHYAVQQLRKKMDVSDIGFLAWVPYVHFGL